MNDEWKVYWHIPFRLIVWWIWLKLVIRVQKEKWHKRLAWLERGQGG